jgi:hypothetical protein
LASSCRPRRTASSGRGRAVRCVARARCRINAPSSPITCPAFVRHVLRGACHVYGALDRLLTEYPSFKTPPPQRHQGHAMGTPAHGPAGVRAQGDRPPTREFPRTLMRREKQRAKRPAHSKARTCPSLMILVHRATCATAA